MLANPATAADAAKLRMSEPEAALLTHIRAMGLPEPELEYQFCVDRKWKFDGAWPDERVAYECEGGTWRGGRHVRGGGYEKDCAKYNTATLIGWRVYRFTTEMIADGRAITTLLRALAPRPPERERVK